MNKPSRCQSYRALRQQLTRAGFVETVAKRHRLYEHTRTGARITLHHQSNGDDAGRGATRAVLTAIARVGGQPG